MQYKEKVPGRANLGPYMWVVVKIMVPFWIPIIIRHLVFRVPKRDHNFDNHLCLCTSDE